MAPGKYVSYIVAIFILPTVFEWIWIELNAISKPLQPGSKLNVPFNGVNTELYRESIKYIISAKWSKNTKSQNRFAWRAKP